MSSHRFAAHVCISFAYSAALSSIKYNKKVNTAADVKKMLDAAKEASEKFSNAIDIWNASPSMLSADCSSLPDGFKATGSGNWYSVETMTSDVDSCVHLVFSVEHKISFAWHLCTIHCKYS